MNLPTNLNDDFLTFVSTFRDELLSMPDAEVLEGADIEQLGSRRSRILAAAKKEAGRRRLANAKAKLALTREQAGDSEEINPGDARLYIAHAANDLRYTLVARELGAELSDEDAVRIYRQLRSLERGPSKDET
jgi:hypothetical protein